MIMYIIVKWLAVTNFLIIIDTDSAKWQSLSSSFIGKYYDKLVITSIFGIYADEI